VRYFGKFLEYNISFLNAVFQETERYFGKKERYFGKKQSGISGKKSGISGNLPPQNPHKIGIP